jgi:hypothetical protein
LDFGFVILDFGFVILDFGFWIHVRNPQSPIRNQYAGNLENEVRTFKGRGEDYSLSRCKDVSSIVSLSCVSLDGL